PFCPHRVLHSFPPRRSSVLRLGMRNCFLGLWHHIIICSDNNNCNICYLSTPCPHRGKGFVTRCIKKCDLLTPIKNYPIGTNMLRSEEHTSELQSRENLVCRL